MTPAAIRALASRVETEEPSEELRAAVLTAFGSEAEPGSAPDPLRSVDDAIALTFTGWRLYCACLTSLGKAHVDLITNEKYKYTMQSATGGTLARAWTAANLRALAWEMER